MHAWYIYPQEATMAQADLVRLDRALLRLRRIWDAPAGIPQEGAVVEGSTLLVCLAVDERGGEADVGQVATALAVVHSTASRLVGRATEAGMVERGSAASDPRRAAIRLTDAGARLVAASRDFRAARLATITADWPDRDVGALADLLDRFATAAGGLPPPPVAG